ncbi:pseudouridine synthase [Xanthobacter sp. DSM 24535]|uniref:pseudouridine synthase n=1 Tax=Roseixanthobacter psychrophilus TaxID=3119917 RepID=UPI0037279596
MPRTQPPRKDKNRVPRDKRALPQAKTNDAERVAKVIARAGLGSRREIETWIEAGRIAVNGIVLTSPAFTVTEKDRIEVDGQPLPERERTRLYLYHKPKGVVTTNRDPEGRTTLFEILPKGLPRLVSVGRLDLNSEGLLLLTNDGGLARALELPETGWLRRYRVRANGAIDQAKLDALLGGITVEGIEYGPIEATLDRVQGANAWISVSLREGKNREVRNVLAALGMRVNRLIRVSYGPFQLGEIPENGIDEVGTRILRDQLGEELAAAAGVDFDAPLFEREIEEAPRFAPRPADEADRSGRRGTMRREVVGTRHDTDIEHRGRSRHPHGDGESEGGAFRVRSRRKDERETVSAGTVADRKGRQVKVERFVPEPQEERFDPRRPARPGAGQRFGARPERAEAGRFARTDDRPRTSRADEGGHKRGPARFAREDGPPARGPRRDGGGAPHKPIFGRGRPEGTEGGFRREGGAGKPAGFRSERGEGRSSEGRSRDEGGYAGSRPAGRPRPQGSEGGFRREGGPGKPGGFRAERGEGRSSEGRSRDEGGYAGSRPAGRPRPQGTEGGFRREGGPGKPGGFRTERPKPFSADKPERAPRREASAGYGDKRAPRREEFGSAPSRGPKSYDKPRDEAGRSPRPRTGGFAERGRGADDVGFTGTRSGPAKGRNFGDRPPREGGDRSGGERGGFGGGKPRGAYGSDKPRSSSAPRGEAGAERPRGGFGAGPGRDRPAGKGGFAGGRPRATEDGSPRTGFRPGGKAGPGGPKRPGFGGPKSGPRSGAPRSGARPTGGKPSGPRKRD